MDQIGQMAMRFGMRGTAKCVFGLGRRVVSAVFALLFLHNLAYFIKKYLIIVK
jgi:hypothetical protein